jgi:hypothetical protein
MAANRRKAVKLAVVIAAPPVHSHLKAPQLSSKKLHMAEARRRRLTSPSLPPPVALGPCS